MCGRFALGIPKKRLEECFGLPVPDEYLPRFNIAPGSEVLVVEAAGMGWRRWGLVPPWAEDPKVGYRMINARSESVFDKPSFREPVRSARCLVPAQAFYEWRKDGKVRQPFAIAVRGEDVCAMAGIMARWQDGKTGEVVDSVAVLTCPPNSVMKPIHDRMPVILDRSAWGVWLDPSVTASEKLVGFLTPSPAETMTAWPVSDAVNKPGIDRPDLLEKVVSPAVKQGSLL